MFSGEIDSIAATASPSRSRSLPKMALFSRVNSMALLESHIASSPDASLTASVLSEIFPFKNLEICSLFFGDFSCEKAGINENKN